MSTKTVAVQLVAMTSQYQKSMGAATASTAKLQATSASAGKGIGAVMGPQIALGAAIAAGAAVKMALDFDNAFTRIAAVTDTSTAQVGKWKEQVLALSGSTARAPKELAEALYFLASAGLDTSEVMPTLEASAKAAASGLGETADIARLTANAMNAYSKSGLTAMEVTDTLVAAVREGTAEPDEFADAMGRILPIAAKAGISFDQVAASLAGLSNIGLDVNEGVTAMRGVMVALLAPGKQAADQLAELGLSADDVRSSLAEDGLIATLRLLEGATGGNIDMLRKIIPNVRAMAGAFGLTGQEAAKVDEIFRDVMDSSGSLDKSFAKTQESAGHKLRQAFVDLQRAGIELGTALLPVFVALAEGASKLASAIGPVVDVFTNAQKAIVRYADAFNDAVVPGQQLMANSMAIKDALAKGIITTDQAHAAITAFGDANVYADDTIAGLHKEIALAAGGMVQGASEADRYGEKIGGIGGAAEDSEGPIAGFGDATAGAAAEMDAAAKAADDFALALKGLTGIAFDAEDAALAWNASLDEMHAELREGAKTLNINTEAGRANREAIKGAAADAIADAVARRQEGASIEKATGILKDHVAKLREDAIAAGFSADAIDAYIRQLNLTPKQIKTLIKLEKSQAEAALSTFIGNLDRIPDIKDVLIRVRSTGMGTGQQLGHTGGTVGALPAKRYHGGGTLRGGEEWFVGQKGERVLSLSEMRTLRGIIGGGGSTSTPAPQKSGNDVRVAVRLDRRRFTDELDHDATYAGRWSG